MDGSHDRHCDIINDVPLFYISRWWHWTLNMCLYFMVISQSGARVSTEHGINIYTQFHKINALISSQNPIFSGYHLWYCWLVHYIIWNITFINGSAPSLPTLGRLTSLHRLGKLFSNTRDDHWGTEVVYSTSLMASLFRSISGLSKCFYQGLRLADLNADVIGPSINRRGVI